ncbi:hypothetical protein [Ramlibacter sp. AN1133]|uniref:hypothetical protein n=1 Tax=Ramlibacter sp. AN1133 TaxID=3133429 RepID=UPI0030BEC280
MNELRPAAPPAPVPDELFAFECRVVGFDGGTIINSTSRGKALGEFFHSLDGDYPFTDLRARKVGPPRSSEAFLRTARYRGLPNVRCGDRVLVGRDTGVIVGHNDSANFDVLFDRDSRYKGLVLNVHPSELKLITMGGVPCRST